MHNKSSYPNKTPSKLKQKSHKRSIQLNLFPPDPKEHGGTMRLGKRKTKRPLHSKKITHLVLKCRKVVSLYKNREFVLKTIQKQAARANVKIYELSIQHDHIHTAIICQKGCV